jgi:phosphate transport system ATP-binding protein
MESKILTIENLNVYYGKNQVIKNINLDFEKNKITAIIGPSGCGKSTLLRTINRMHELIPNAKVEGKINLNNKDIYKINPIIVRRKIGMVFQRPNPFPTMSIYDNVISGYKLNNIKMKKKEFDFIVEDTLKKVALWNEVKDSLYRKGSFLSGGQQQRLCIARALAVQPDIILLDEPTSALDPAATARIEELTEQLKKSVTIIIVTHNIGQAGRISDNTIFLYLGELIEYGSTKQLFSIPQDKRTEEYLSGKFG